MRRVLTRAGRHIAIPAHREHAIDMLSLGLRSLAPLRRLPPLRTLFLSAARRDASAAAALLDEPHTAALHSDADVADAIQAACQALGRQSGDAEDGLATKLRDNWYSTAADVAGMSDAQAASLGVPLRLRDTIALELAAAAAPPPAALQGRAMPAAAAELLDAALDAGAPSWADAADIGSEDEGAGAATPPAAAKDVEQPGWEQLPIELRVCPPLARKGFKLSEARNVSKRARGAPYALSEAEMSPALRAELEALTAFATQRFFGAQAEPIAPVTAAKYCDHLRGMLGWTHRVGGVPLDRLSLAALVPSAERAAVAPAFAYVQWLTKERAISVRTEGLVLRAVMAAAKFLYHSQSRVQAGSGDKPYSDLEVVKELRGLSNATRKASKVAARTSGERSSAAAALSAAGVQECCPWPAFRVFAAARRPAPPPPRPPPPRPAPSRRRPCRRGLEVAGLANLPGHRARAAA